MWPMRKQWKVSFEWGLTARFRDPGQQTELWS
jgi:hypothetical protein